MPRRILLSYAREDAAVVVEMAADLRALDHEVWLDQDLGGGQDWWDEIIARIRWCTAFLPVLSTAYLGSRACTGERAHALALERPVLPVAVGDLGPEGLLDEDLARRQRISYRPADKPSTLRLLAAVHRLVPAPPLPAVEPTPPPAPVAHLGALRAELDGDGSIDFERQLVLLGHLSAEAEDTNRHPEVAALITAFLARRDIALFVERQLTQLQARLADVPSTRPDPQPTPPRADVVRDDAAVLELAVFTDVGRPSQLQVYRTRPVREAVQLDGRVLHYDQSPDGSLKWEYDGGGVTVVHRRDTNKTEVRVKGVVVFP